MSKVSLVKGNVPAYRAGHLTITTDDKIRFSDLTADTLGWGRFAPKINYVHPTRGKIIPRQRRSIMARLIGR